MKRLDQTIVSNGLIASREKAKLAILSGLVSVDGKVVTKPAFPINEANNIILKEQPLKYVSRGGLKLEAALSIFGLDVNGAIAVDIGSSTGGFADCLLQNGTQKVYCIDVGSDQLDKVLRERSDVVVFEKTDIRGFDVKNIYELSLGQGIDIITADVSFISLLKIAADVKKLMKKNTHAVLLIKPQFEAGRSGVGKGGIVKGYDKHVKIVGDVINGLGESGLAVINLAESPIKGQSGNTEYLALCVLNENAAASTVCREKIKTVVKEALCKRE